jgi:signal transduction histidine kinase
MPLLTFIEGHHSEIIWEFSAFARTLAPPEFHLTETDLRDHAEELLTAVAEDLRTAQTEDEQSRKSRGLGTAKIMAVSGRLHADGRIRHGFTATQVMAEFRALRASVLRLYELTGNADPGGVRRFNEAIDEALTESMQRFGEQTDLYRDQFIGILGHDLRTPLSAIYSLAALLAASPNDDLRQTRVAARILNSARRMARMIEDLLDLTRTRLGGGIPLKRARTDLQQLCEEVMLELQASRGDARVRLESSGAVVGDWDADRLAQLVSNLVANALQHGDGGIVTLSLIGDAGETVRLSVHNAGQPIPTDAQKAIFEPLVRRSSQGTDSIGLGLFIARAIARAHGGEISVASTIDAGTTFELVLPRR